MSIIQGFSGHSRLVERGARPCGVDLLCGRLGRGSERCVVGDAVAVSVGGDYAGGLAPGRRSSSVVRLRSKGLRPRHALGQRAVEYGVGACLDQLLSLVERCSHLDVDDSMRLCKEAGDESRWLASPAGACGPGGRPLDPVVEDGGDVVGVAEPARCGEAREKRIDIVMVRFSPAKSSCERAERLGRDGAIGLLSRKPRATVETGPAVLLGCGGDGFVLGGELSERAPLFLLGDDGLVRREFGPAVLQNAVENAPCGGVRVVAGMWLRVVVGAVERHVGAVRVPSSGHRDVEGLPRRGRFDQYVRSVGRDALRSVGGDCVAEINMFGHVRGWEEDAAAEPASMLAGLDGSVVADGGDGPDVAVAHPVPPGQGAEAAVVEARDDGVAHAGGGAVSELDLAVEVQRLAEDQVRTGASVQRCHVFVGFGDQHGDQACVPVGAPCIVGGVCHGLGVAVGDALVGEVGVDGLGASVA